VRTLEEFPGVPVAPEEGQSLLENACSKARHYMDHCGLPALADDSGLMVAALAGAPGVRSARYAGESATDRDNRARLLAELGGVADRRAEFVCVLCLVAPGAAPLVVTGRCHGHITHEERGQGGFGYDSLFVPEDPSAGGATFAELPPHEKARLSHRGKALAQLGRALASWLEAPPSAAGTP
jgi:XTP/dITP diphosphohydrolase